MIPRSSKQSQYVSFSKLTRHTSKYYSAESMFLVNPECRIPNVESMTIDQMPKPKLHIKEFHCERFCHSGFGHSFFIRISTFVIGPTSSERTLRSSIMRLYHVVKIIRKPVKRTSTMTAVRNSSSLIMRFKRAPSQVPSGTSGRSHKPYESVDRSIISNII